MLHKAQKQKILLTNANVLINQRSFSTLNDESKPVRVNRKYKTQSYNNLYNSISKTFPAQNTQKKLRKFF